MLHPVLGSSAQTGHGLVEEVSDKATTTIRGMEHLLWGMVGRVGVVQTEEEKAPVGPYCDLLIFKQGVCKMRKEVTVLD